MSNLSAYPNTPGAQDRDIGKRRRRNVSSKNAIVWAAIQPARLNWR